MKSTGLIAFVSLVLFSALPFVQASNLGSVLGVRINTRVQNLPSHERQLLLELADETFDTLDIKNRLKKRQYLAPTSSSNRTFFLKGESWVGKILKNINRYESSAGGHLYRLKVGFYRKGERKYAMSVIAQFRDADGVRFDHKRGPYYMGIHIKLDVVSVSLKAAKPRNKPEKQDRTVSDWSLIF